MTANDLILQVRHILQDYNGEYFTSSELLGYINDAMKAISSENVGESLQQTLTTETGTNLYEIDGVLRYVRITDGSGNNRPLHTDDGTGDDVSDAIIVRTYKDIYINTPEADTLVIRYVGLPEEVNANDLIRVGHELAIKYYTVQRAFEKDEDMQDLSKSGYFMLQYEKELVKIKKTYSLDFNNSTRSVEGYYF